MFRTSLIRGEFGLNESRSTPTVALFEQRLLSHWEANVQPRTFGFYKQNLEVLNRFTPLAFSRLYQINAPLIESFVQWRLKQNVTPVMVNHALRTLRRVLHIAQEWNLIRVVPKIRLLRARISGNTC